MKSFFAFAAVALAVVSCAGGREPSVEALKPYESEGQYVVPVKDVTITMKKIEGTFFLMGETFDLGVVRNPEIKPAFLDGYAIGTEEVSRDLWAAVMGGEAGKAPKAGVTWADAIKFTEKLSRLTGIPFRLPTEAEWEYAAKGGEESHNCSFSGSNVSMMVSWCEQKDAKTHPVAGKKANELGIYDMSGNAWEWVQDRSGKYSEEAQTNPTGPSKGENTADLRVIRGGSVNSKWPACRVSNRSENYAEKFKSTIGFRLAL